MKNYTSNGIAFTEEIANIEGAAFVLFPESTHTSLDISKAKAEIRRDRDVVSLTIATEEDRDEEYRVSLFLVPITKSLKWYEMNTERKSLIRKARKSGITPEEFVNKWILPYVKETRESNFKKYGKDLMQ